MRWSSYRATAGLQEPPHFPEVERLLSQFSSQPARARRAYRWFGARGKGVKIWEDLKGGVILGGERMVKGLEPPLKKRKCEFEVPRRERLAARPALDELFAGVKDREERDVRIYRAVVEHGYRLAEMREYLGGLRYFTVSRFVGKQRSEVKT